MKIKDAFEGYLAYRKEMGVSAKTLTDDRIALFKSFPSSISDRELGDLTLNDVAEVISEGRKYGAYGPRHLVTVFRKLMRYIRDSGYAIPFDLEDIEPPEPPQTLNEYLTVPEMNKVLNSFNLNKLSGLRMRALCEVLFASGLRISEALSLYKVDVDWGGKEIHLTNAKTKDQETVCLTNRSLLWLRRYLDARRDDIPYLFTSGKGKMPAQTSRWYLDAHVAHLGIKKKINHHLFRKSFTTLLIQNKADIKTVQTLCRHKNPQTTLRYYAANNKERSKEIYTEIMNQTLTKVDYLREMLPQQKL
jgi:integrase/recombinase XerD